MEKLYQIIEKFQGQATRVFSQPETYMQIAIILVIYVVAYTVAIRIRKYASFLDAKSENEHHPIYVFLGKLGDLIFPILAILILRITSEVTPKTLPHDWIIQTLKIRQSVVLLNGLVFPYYSCI